MEKQKLNLVAIHGWAGGAWIWEDLQAKLPLSSQLIAIEREGCFPSSLPPVDKVDGIITHSFGLHCIPLPILEKAKFLIILSGFASFIPVTDLLIAKKQKQALTLLLRKYNKDPYQCVADFYSHMLPHNTKLPFASVYNPDKVKTELASLGNVSLNKAIFPPILDIHILHGVNDDILPLVCFDELTSLFPTAKSYLLNETGHGSFTSQEGISICQDIMNAYVTSL